MAQDELNKDAAAKKKVQTKEKDKTKKDKPPTKVVVRRLPPTMTEEIFIEQISPLPENDLFYFVKGEQHVGVPNFSRAYINFLNIEEIFTFQEKFDGYVFLDEKGVEYPAVVEFAPYQRISRYPEPGSKEDKCNTIDNDPHYLQFVKRLEQPEEFVLPSAETYLEQLELREREFKANGHPKMITPLVEFIQQRRIDRDKFREEKKDERRRKEMEKKKQRELERINKKRESKREDKKSEKAAVKVKKEDDRPPNPVKVLKNTEREAQEKTEKQEKQEAAAAARKVKEASRPKGDRPTKEKTFKERPLKPKTEKKVNTSDSTESSKLGTQQQEIDHPIQPKKTVAKREQTKPQPTDDNPGPSSKSEEEKPNKSQTENEPSDKERKIRNKDRPAIQIYRPGAKRITTQKSDDPSVTDSPPTTGMKREVKTRTFTRTSAKE
nr:EOG090X04G9 [Scapholeberis mucronata]